MWFTIVVFARLYTTVLCEFIARIPGLDFICYTWIHGIASYLWIEIIFYGPVIWFALYEVKGLPFSLPKACSSWPICESFGLIALHPLGWSQVRAGPR